MFENISDNAEDPNSGDIIEDRDGGSVSDSSRV